jgi:hypothetical protein
VLVPYIYDPALNPLYRDVLAHYGAVAMPGLCPPETSHVGIDAGREGVYICLDPEPKWKFRQTSACGKETGTERKPRISESSTC